MNETQPNTKVGFSVCPLLFLPNDYLDEAEEHSGQHEQMGLPPSPFKKRFREPVQLLDKMQGSALKKTRTSGVFSLNVYCFLILLCFQKSSLVLHSRPRAKLMTS